MGKFVLFSLLWWLLGNPFLAIVVLLVILYVLDRRFLGLSPSFLKPLKRTRRLAKLRQELRLHPHDSRGRLEAAQLLAEKKKYREALDYYESVLPVMEDSAEVRFGIGLCRLRLGEREEGEREMREALRLNPRVHYGEPYLRLGEALAESAPDRALAYLEAFREVHSSSCEAYYRLGLLYKRLGREEEARRAFAETVQLYRSLPKYKRRSERRWALLAFWKR
ncbi:hypothetical protein J31TS4_13840 [Paenibacillus sp. J31TS4]|uniref:tetratricopeptide repeat protein n=1 Tax=Paenibacillus sp. J31TS4 TaxID=2807195 RepID=UPI001B17413B|nr:tetratricopeptide repeat protein [Paenibacillus sp. J31TS4]GIP38104.1 hypothetical protein J31TS4_13840 [Paenibacillus sp. J31TS4]